MCSVAMGVCVVIGIGVYLCICRVERNKKLWIHDHRIQGRSLRFDDSAVDNNLGYGSLPIDESIPVPDDPERTEQVFSGNNLSSAQYVNAYPSIEIQRMMPDGRVLRGTLTYQDVARYPNGIIMGRDAMADVRFAEKCVSRHHACIRAVKGHYELVDLGALNGLEHNGCRLASRQSVMLTSGDLIDLGGVCVKVIIS